MYLKNFTVKSQESIQQAQQLALGKDHQSIERSGHEKDNGRSKTKYEELK